MDLSKFSPGTLWRKARALGRKLWVRVVVMGLLAFVVLGLTQILQGFVPRTGQTQLTGVSTDRLLQIIANAMLAVTTFSLTVMVTAYRSSSDQFTPRVHRLIIQDPVTQNTLATFIGAYVYALLAIILRELDIYADEEALVLFGMTVLVLAFIVLSLIRWVLHLQTFGSLIDSTRRVEGITRAQFLERLKTPCLGATPWAGELPQDAETLAAADSGYIQMVYPEVLDQVAGRHGVELYLTQDIGSFVFEGQTLMMVHRVGAAADGCDSDMLSTAVRQAVVMGDVRTYDQDPRFGLMVMGEIASKALSPGINDPGTAIDVIARIGRILWQYRDETAGDAPKYPNLHLRPLSPADLIEDGFASLARDGAGIVEVQQRLQKALRALMQHTDPGLRAAAREAAALAYRRAVSAMSFAPDRGRLSASTSAEVLEQVEGAETSPSSRPELDKRP